MHLLSVAAFIFIPALSRRSLLAFMQIVLITLFDQSLVNLTQINQAEERISEIEDQLNEIKHSRAKGESSSRISCLSVYRREMFWAM